ncbi:hypothetical protein L1887_19148 [Cichorium endivia]|nr:hypothetical protein L1887_19148 [Cichorium endivia]
MYMPQPVSNTLVSTVGVLLAPKPLSTNNCLSLSNVDAFYAYIHGLMLTTLPVKYFALVALQRTHQITWICCYVFPMASNLDDLTSQVTITHRCCSLLVIRGLGGRIPIGSNESISAPIRVNTGACDLAMSRPVLLVSLLLLMIFTSQFEWNQHIVNEVEARPLALSQKQQYVLEREESIKEKIILSQEKHIQKLKSLVQSLQEQLLACRGKDDIVSDTTGSLTELLNELNPHQIME